MFKGCCGQGLHLGAPHVLSLGFMQPFCFVPVLQGARGDGCGVATLIPPPLCGPETAGVMSPVYWLAPASRHLLHLHWP